ncbi:MAG: NAD(P)H-hydrate epimerase, partial [Chlamydiota bacterium]
MISTDGLKVVTAEEMVRLEELAIEQGCSAEKFMEEAGKKVALAALRFMQQRHLPKRVVLLIGKGNKGGDAYMAGRILLEKEVQVRAIVLYRPQECSSLNQKMGEGFKAQGGRIEQARGSIDFSEDALIVDGLLGTGFKGKVESPIAE